MLEPMADGQTFLGSVAKNLLDSEEEKEDPLLEAVQLLGRYQQPLGYGLELRVLRPQVPVTQSVDR